MLVELQQLEVYQYYLNKKGQGKKYQIDTFSGKKTDYTTGKVIQSLFHVHDNIDGDFYHTNYLSYLENCWGSHLGVVLTPDIIWYTLLCELTSIVSKDVEKFRHLFTDSKEKQKILVPDTTKPILPLNLVIEQLRHLVPDCLADNFLEDFSTSDDRAIEARYAAFADLVSPYYSYGMFCCGISKIDIRGTKEDWKNLASRWELANQKGLVDGDYYKRVKGILNNLVKQIDNPDVEFLKKIFWGKRCGSGSQIDVYGWFTDLYKDAPEDGRFSHNFATHVAKVEYEHIQTKEEWEMRQGILSSKLVGDMLEPMFGRIVYEKRKTTESPSVECELQIETETIIATNKLKADWKVY